MRSSNVKYGLVLVLGGGIAAMAACAETPPATPYGTGGYYYVPTGGYVATGNAMPTGGWVASGGYYATGGVGPVPTGGVGPVPTGGVGPVPTGGVGPVPTGGVAPATGGAQPATGGASPATGGSSPATGGASTNTGGTSSTGSCMGNYLDSSPLMGYCFSFQVVGGTTTDGDAETDGLEFPYSLPGDSYDDVAMAGCNVNQDADGGDALTYDTTGDTGICVDGSGFQRIQIQVSETQSWCAKPDASGCAAWADFNSACWDNSGTYYVADDGQPAIEAVLVAVPSGTSGPMSGTICVENISVQ